MSDNFGWDERTRRQWAEQESVGIAEWEKRAADAAVLEQAIVILRRRQASPMVVREVQRLAQTLVSYG